MADRSEIEKLMATLGAAYPRPQIAEETLAVYARMLGDLPFEELAKAVMRLIATSEFFPTISSIRKAVTDLRLPAPPADVEWRKVLDKASGRICEPWGPFTQAAVDAIGWDRIRLDERPEFTRRDFVAAYKEIVERGLAQEQVAGLEMRRPQLRAGKPVAMTDALKGAFADIDKRLAPAPKEDGT